MKKILNKESNEFSKFWMSRRPKSTKTNDDIEKLMDLADYRRAVSNFVKIVTMKDIPVKYAVEQDMSWTDGKVVTISSRIEDGDFDPIVGLALHEASHIKLTNFVLWNALETSIPEEIYRDAEKINIPRHATVKILRFLFNWVEDRRIDSFMFTTAPGYKGYYMSLYDRYFNSDIVTEGLKSKLKREENVDSYSFRTCNLINDARDLTALKGLQEIWDEVNLKNISRLTDSKAALNCAFNIYRIFLKYLDPAKNLQDKNDAEEREKQREEDKKNGKKPGKGKPGKGGGGGGFFDKDVPGENGESDEQEEVDLTGLSDKEFEELLNKAAARQGNFVGGRVAKVKMTKEQEQKLGMLQDAKSELKQVQVYTGSNYNKKKYKVLVLRQISRAFFESNMFPFSSTFRAGYEDEVKEGVVLGTILGKKLQVRNEEKVTIFTRKDAGKIDRRLIADFGFGSRNLFSQKFVEKYARAILHITIDVSGSMLGDKLGKAITTTTAICKAASMISNLNVVVSLRGSLEQAGRFACVAIIYDSRVDKFIKVKQWFPYLCASGMTPEGLCYEAMEKEIVSSSKDLKSYFLNFSDGAPWYSEGSGWRGGGDMDYFGEAACRHTAQQVKNMKMRGIKVLGYFIGDSNGYGGDDSRQFRMMYGANSKFINTSNMIEVAKTMNEMFLSDDAKM